MSSKKGKPRVDPRPTILRLAEKFTVGDGCWEWKAGKNGPGYGLFRVRDPRRKVMAHRIVYELLVGPIPEGLFLDHLCRNVACVRPDHLEPVTHKENIRRAPRYAVTACCHGHPFDVENTYIKPNGTRSCRQCGRDRYRRGTAA